MCAKAEDGTHTLMKGDEGIERRHERGDLALLSLRWKPDRGLFPGLNRVGSDRPNAGRLFNVSLNGMSGEAVIEELSINRILILKPNDVSIFEVDWVFAGHKPWNAYCANTRHKQVTDYDLT